MGERRLCTAALLLLFGSIAVCGVAAQETGLPSSSGQKVTKDQNPAPKTFPATRNEDWSVLRADPATLGPLSTAVLGLGDNQYFSREIVRVQWRFADPIDLYIMKPHGVKNPPVVLYLYDYKANTDRFRDDSWCKRATQDGFAAIGFVSAFSLPRFANRPMKQWFVSELQEALGSSAHDVQMILNYLEKRGDLDVKEVGMFGQGSGGAVAVLAAQADPRISVLDLLDPWGDWPDWLKYSPQIPENERPDYLTPEFLESIENLEPTRYLPQLKLKALRVQQSMDDPMTPEAAKAKIASAVQPPDRLVQYKNQQAHLAEWRVHGLSGWLHDQMRPSLSSPSLGFAPEVSPPSGSSKPSPDPILQLAR